MIFAGCDVGSLSAEAVVIKDESIISSDIIRVRPRPEQSARAAPRATPGPTSNREEWELGLCRNDDRRTRRTLDRKSD